ncbi:hypothetical protein I4F81_001492 [Pyropia yezoensis]|uniref:Uncharacterized protein n=1 Tax=Pyropia yezoensis TaxID=2788 RepID=A0ACC3BM53_PYRYE|nr:hypothetical protein I4F81_001492 [Neopyropia yezoensis]
MAVKPLKAPILQTTLWRSPQSRTVPLSTEKHRFPWGPPCLKGEWRGRQGGVDLQCTTAAVAAPGHRSGRTYPAVMATGENGCRRGGQPGAGVRVAPCLPRRQPAQVPVGEGGSRQREQPRRPAAEAAGHGCRSGSAGVVREVAGGCSVGSGRSTWPLAASVQGWPRR